MTLNELMKVYTGNACISIEGYCEEEEYDYCTIPLDYYGEPDEEIFSGENPNHYVPSCLAKESWYEKIKDGEVERITVMGGEMIKPELCIKLKEQSHAN